MRELHEVGKKISGQRFDRLNDRNESSQRKTNKDFLGGCDDKLIGGLS